MGEMQEQERAMLEESSDMDLSSGQMEENRFLIKKIDGLEKMTDSLSDAMQKIAENGEATARQLNQVNENLHRENQRLKEGLYDSMILPVLQDIIGIGLDIAREIKRCKRNGEVLAAESLEDVLEDLHEMLEKYRVQVYQPQEGEPYEPVVQRVLETIETDERQRHRTIAKVCSVGYRFIKDNTSIVLMPSKVNVYILKRESLQSGGKKDE